MTDQPYIIVDSRELPLRYVCAPPGWTWTFAGLEREPAGYRSPSPEWTIHANRAYVFRSHRAAARVANICGQVEIRKADGILQQIERAKGKGTS